MILLTFYGKFHTQGNFVQNLHRPYSVCNASNTVFLARFTNKGHYKFMFIVNFVKGQTCVQQARTQYCPLFTSWQCITGHFYKTILTFINQSKKMIYVLNSDETLKIVNKIKNCQTFILSRQRNIEKEQNCAKFMMIIHYAYLYPVKWAKASSFLEANLSLGDFLNCCLPMQGVPSVSWEICSEFAS